MLTCAPCNRTMPYDATALTEAARTAGAARVETFEAMCQHQLALRRVLEGDAVVTCTQEARLLTEVATDKTKVSTVRFFNSVKLPAGRPRHRLPPKLAALIASAMLPDAEPTTQVSYKSAGQTLVIGALAMPCDGQSAEGFPVSVLATCYSGGATSRRVARHARLCCGQRIAVRRDGWLGAFDAMANRRTRLTDARTDVAPA